mmetsp:Transcript_23436/g.59802  ORF Transcript_23436/g.59802 Transcript_23436/m.59802 type:complete len:311 (+) Transcript_23436:624-1556(+)
MRFHLCPSSATERRIVSSSAFVQEMRSGFGSFSGRSTFDSFDWVGAAAASPPAAGTAAAPTAPATPAAGPTKAPLPPSAASALDGEESTSRISRSRFQRLRTASSERPGNLEAILRQRHPCSTTDALIIESSASVHSLRSAPLRAGLAAGGGSRGRCAASAAAGRGGGRGGIDVTLSPAGSALAAGSGCAAYGGSTSSGGTASSTLRDAHASCGKECTAASSVAPTPIASSKEPCTRWRGFACSSCASGTSSGRRGAPRLRSSSNASNGQPSRWAGRPLADAGSASHAASVSRSSNDAKCESDGGCWGWW